MDKKTEHVRSNYRAFRALLPELLEAHTGKYALMRKGEVVQFFDTARDAMVYAVDKYDDDLYSVQEVSAGIVDQGWFSHAPHYASV